LVLYLASFALLAGLLINLFSKISLHALGWGAFAASLTAIDIRLGADFHLHVVASILLGGIAGFARLRQQAHNPSQLYAGYLTGIAVVTAIMSSI
jgi:hypothetical protein